MSNYTEINTEVVKIAEQCAWHADRQKVRWAKAKHEITWREWENMATEISTRTNTEITPEHLEQEVREEVCRIKRVHIPGKISAQERNLLRELIQKRNIKEFSSGWRERGSQGPKWSSERFLVNGLGINPNSISKADEFALRDALCDIRDEIAESQSAEGGSEATVTEVRSSIKNWFRDLCIFTLSGMIKTTTVDGVKKIYYVGLKNNAREYSLIMTTNKSTDPEINKLRFWLNDGSPASNKDHIAHLVAPIKEVISSSGKEDLSVVARLKEKFAEINGDEMLKYFSATRSFLSLSTFCYEAAGESIGIAAINEVLKEIIQSSMTHETFNASKDHQGFIAPLTGWGVDAMKVFNIDHHNWCKEQIKGKQLYDVCPLIYNFVAGTSSPQAIMAWVWRMLEGRQGMRQALLLIGKGATGKSKFIEALRTYIGYQYCAAFDPKSASEKHRSAHASSALIGKVLVAIEEIGDENIFDGGLVKLMISKDVLQVNPKNEAMFSEAFRGGVIIASNHAPYINPFDMSQISRALFVNCPALCKQISIGEDELRARMAQEMPFFVAYCEGMSGYVRNMPGLEDCIEMDDAMYGHILDKACRGEHSATLYYIKNSLVSAPGKMISVAAISKKVVSSVYYSAAGGISDPDKLVMRRKIEHLLSTKLDDKRVCKNLFGFEFTTGVGDKNGAKYLFDVAYADPDLNREEHGYKDKNVTLMFERKSQVAWEDIEPII